MKTIYLWRVAHTCAGMQGVFKYNNKVFSLTLEPPWRDNKSFESCIPAGPYSVRLAPSPTRPGNPLVWWVQGVKGRDGIQIHKGDGVEDTSGCIIIGDQFDLTNSGAIRIYQSSHAWTELMALVNADKTFMLVIEDRYL